MTATCRHLDRVANLLIRKLGVDNVPGRRQHQAYHRTGGLGHQVALAVVVASIGHDAPLDRRLDRRPPDPADNPQADRAGRQRGGLSIIMERQLDRARRTTGERRRGHGKQSNDGNGL